MDVQHTNSEKQSSMEHLLVVVLVAYILTFSTLKVINELILKTSYQVKVKFQNPSKLMM